MESYTYSINKIISQVLSKIFNKYRKFDKHLKLIATTVIIVCVCMVAVVWLQTLMFQRFLTDHIFFLDDLNSDHKDLMLQKVIYNNALMMHEYGSKAA